MDETVRQLAKNAAASLNSNPPHHGIKAFRALLAADPDRPDDWYNLAWLLRRGGQYDASLVAYDEALRRGVSGAQEVHLNRAVIFSEGLRRPDKAREELKQALELQPDYVAALLNLGNLHEDEGEREQALDHYQQALELEPDNTLALMRVAEVSCFRNADDPFLNRIRRHLGAKQLAPLERADLGFALGRGLNQAGAYDDAFEAYTDANRASGVAGGLAYEAEAIAAHIDEIIRVFGEPQICADTGPSPIFICGMFRSGSTLAERMLGAHTDIVAGGEFEFIPEIVGRDLQPYPQFVGKLTRGDLNGLRDRYLVRLAQQSLSPSGLTDKRPDNFLHVGLIKRLFPTAKIIHTVRNPLDTCLSAYFAHLDPRMTYAQSLESLGHWHRHYQRLMCHWHALYTGDIYDFDYDAVVKDPQPEIANLLNFLNLPWDDACLHPHLSGGNVRTASAWQVREPLYQTSSGRWRNYDRHLGPLRTALAG